MSTPSRTENAAVVTRLTAEPGSYSFVQSMRLLERARLLEKPKSGGRLGQLAPVAGFSPPGREVVRLSSSHSLSFPCSEVASVSRADEQWKLRVNHIGLSGAMGVMPFHYTEMILARVRQKDFSLRDFLDLFNHRIVSLFYQASVKYRLPLSYERDRLFKKPDRPVDGQTQALLSLIGLGTRGLTDRSAVSDEALIFYGGLLSGSVRTASGLRQILEHYFQIPVSIEQFVPQWQELIPDIRTRLVSRQMPKGQNASLGRTVVLGSKGWFSQGKINIRLGPLNYEQFQRFAPGTTALRALNDMVRIYVGSTLDYSFVIQVQRKNFPRRIAIGRKAHPQMGWNTWLSSDDGESRHDKRHLSIRVSASRLK